VPFYRYSRYGAEKLKEARSRFKGSKKKRQLQGGGRVCIPVEFSGESIYHILAIQDVPSTPDEDATREDV
jgi:hypothetical protein